MKKQSGIFCILLLTPFLIHTAAAAQPSCASYKNRLEKQINQAKQNELTNQIIGLQHAIDSLNDNCQPENAIVIAENNLQQLYQKMAKQQAEMTSAEKALIDALAVNKSRMIDQAEQRLDTSRLALLDLDQKIEQTEAEINGLRLLIN